MATGNSYVLKCVSCGNEFGRDSGQLYCAKCNSALDVVYDYSSLEKRLPHRQLPFESGYTGVWKYIPLLPVTERTRIITLGEGENSPLIRAKSLGAELGIDNLYVKDETRNPTSSFKDRKSSLIVTKAIENGYKAVACETAGNAGSSLAAYAKKADIVSYVFVSEGISNSKLAKLLSYKPKVFMTRGPSSEIFKFLLEFCKQFGILNGTSASRYNPYVKEGGKTALFEIWEQFERKLPDWIIIPLGGGGNLCSYYKGMKELRELGILDRLPRIVAVQGEYCAPLVEAFDKNLSGEEIPHVRNPHTIAHSIQDDWPPDGDQALEAIRSTNGLALRVSDEEILEASKLLSSTECIFAEPASVAPLAALRNLLASRQISKSESVVLVATGHGLNQPDAAIQAWGRPPEVKLVIEEMRQYVKP